LRGTIHHFTTELGRRSSGGVGTFINEMRRVSGPHISYVLLGDNLSAQDTDPAVTNARFYDMDVLNALPFDTAVFHHYGLAYLADASFLQGRRLIFVVHSIPTTEPWSLLDPYGGHDSIARSFEHMCGAAHAIVCVSEAERGKLLLIYPDLEPKTTVIHNGISGWLDTPVTLAPKRRTFGFLGRCDYRKGLRELLRDFANVDGSLRVACGMEDADYWREARADVERMGLASRVEWLGRVEGGMKTAFLRSLDALIVPSLWEPFGYVALEALQAGIPVLVSQRGGLPEIVGDSYRYLFDPYRAGDIAACIYRFQKDADTVIREQFKHASQAAKQFTAERMALAYDTAAASTGTGYLHFPPIKTYAGRGTLPPPAVGSASATPRPKAPS
jgi:glycosyltransferase involved in cell wall biosynthesis